jgi:hypothetical protein
MTWGSVSIFNKRAKEVNYLICTGVNPGLRVCVCDPASDLEATYLRAFSPMQNSP